MSKRIRASVTFLIVAALLFVPITTQAASLTPYQLQRSGNYFYDSTGLQQNGTTIAGSAPGGGSCYELALPQVNDLGTLARAIDDHIRNTRPNSPFVSPAGLGADIVQGAVRQGVNPMFVVGNLRMESLYATTGTTGTNLAALLRQNFNGFGRTAGASQPHFVAANGRRWYSYSSWVASVNSPDASPNNTTDQPSLMRKVYLDDGLLTIGQYLGRYAPASDGNDESVYAGVMRDVIGDIITRSGTALSCTDNATTITPSAGTEP